MAADGGGGRWGEGEGGRGAGITRVVRRTARRSRGGLPSGGDAHVAGFVSRISSTLSRESGLLTRRVGDY